MFTDSCSTAIGLALHILLIVFIFIIFLFVLGFLSEECNTRDSHFLAYFHLMKRDETYTSRLKSRHVYASGPPSKWWSSWNHVTDFLFCQNEMDSSFQRPKRKKKCLPYHATMHSRSSTKHILYKHNVIELAVNDAERISSQGAIELENGRRVDLLFSPFARPRGNVKKKKFYRMRRFACVTPMLFVFFVFPL